MPFTASDWGTVLAEYDFSITANITSAATLVSAVATTSGSYGSVAQSTDANKPKTGTRTSPTGLNVLDFDGGDLLALDVADQAQPVTIVAVAALDDLGGTVNQQITGNYGGQPTVFSYLGTWQLYAGALGNTAVAEDGAWHVHVAVFNGASSHYWIDGTSYAVSPGTASLAQVLIGAESGVVNGWDGGIAHVIYYNGAVADPAGLNSALTTKWITTGGATATPAATLITVTRPAPIGTGTAAGTATPGAIAVTVTRPTPTGTGDVIVAPATYPQLVVEWNPTVGPFSTSGSWDDITQYVTDGTIRRGRQYELDQFAAGTCSLTLRATTRLFDPDNPSSTYTGNIVPMRQIRLSAVWNSVTYPLFRGYVTDWGQTIAADDNVFFTTIEAKDAFALLEMLELPTSPWALVVQKDNPSLWFRLGETDTTRATDSSTGGNYGIYDEVTQGTDSLVPGDSGDKAIDCTLVDSRVTIQNPSLISGYPFSISFMMKLDNANTDHFHVVFAGLHDTTDNDPSLRIYVERTAGTWTPGSLVCYLVSGGVGLGKRTTYDDFGVVNDNVAHHVVWTVTNSTTSALYVDNTAATTGWVGPVTWPGTVPTGYTIGNYTDVVPGAYQFMGTLDEICVWNGTALTPTQIDDHYHAAKLGWSGDDTGTRVDRLLDGIDWPASLRTIDTGVSTLGVASWSEGASALSVMQGWADTELGAFFVDTSGKIIWRNRHYPILNTRAITSQATFGDGHSSATLKYVADGFEMTRDETLIRNPIQASRNDGITVKVEDATYMAKYGNRSWSAPGTEDLYDAAVRDRAIWLLGRYKELGTRLASMVIKPKRDPTGLWPKALGLELGDRITVKRKPLGLNAEIVTDQIIESIDHRFVASTRDWETTYVGSPVDTTVSTWMILDDTTYGRLDSYYLGY